MDTVVACATAWGRAAIAVLRLSGPEAREIAAEVCPGGPVWRPRRVALRSARDGDRLLDEVLAVWMPGPRSATGEDVVELSCHGNPVIVEALLARCVMAGARPARPGEFTRRALCNGRMDLLRAEALAGLVAAASPEGVRLAQAGLAGEVSDAAAALRDRLLDLAAELEARFDSPGEDLGWQEDAAVVAALDEIAGEARATAETWRAGRVRLHGARVALVGPVNAGKSSLFNALLGERRALVSPEPGTTRDVVERPMLVRGLEITLLDTAGERLDAAPLEREGQALGRALTADVDLTLVILPLHLPPGPELGELLARPDPRLIVGTHADLVAPDTVLAILPDVRVASPTGAGIDALREQIRDAVGSEPASGARVMLVSARQQALFLALAEHAAAAAQALGGSAGPAVAAEELTRALERLAELDGTDAREAVLDRVFSRFCIGK